LIARFGGLVWSLARRLGLPDAETEDAVHEVFTELWRNGNRYDPNIASETAFVATIARRRLIDRRRKLGRQPLRQQLTDAEPARQGPPPRNEVGEEAALASEAFEQLSPEQQRVLRLSVYEGLSHELIARSTGLPLGTVKTHARRGLIRLREMLNKDKQAGGENGSPKAPAQSNGTTPPQEGGE
jgi:RNA polymerase sigma-70 factor (ECF subfamily)